jgi:hypothetical protein
MPRGMWGMTGLPANSLVKGGMGESAGRYAHLGIDDGGQVRSRDDQSRIQICAGANLLSV